MIDLHQHLLPAVDDGSSSIEVSQEMMALAQQLGYTRIVATPHLDGVLSAHYESKVKAALADVKIAASKFDLEVDLGYEIMLSPDLPARLVAGERSRLAGSTTVLVELPFTQWPLYADQTLFDIQALGLRTLLAHPERYHAIQSDPDKALELADRGILMQVTIGSFAGLFGKPAQKLADILLKEGAATVLATDAHGAGRRYLSVEEGLRLAEAQVGADRLRQLTIDNVKALLNSQPLPIPIAIESQDSSERGWKRIFQRGGSRPRS